MLTARDQVKGSDDRGRDSLVECIWMTAGVVQYKLCDRAFECEDCAFDRGFRDAAKSQRKRAVSGAMQEQFVGCRLPRADLKNVCGYEVADTLFYHPNHVWIRVEDQGRIRVGLDDFAQKLTGRIHSVTLPQVGRAIDSKSTLFRIGHRTGETDIAAPVPGTVERINARLFDTPSLINLDPYGDGWTMIIQPAALEHSLKKLVYGDTARSWLEADIEHLNTEVNKLASASSQSIGTTMPDGGVRIHDLTQVIEADQLKRLIDSFLSVPISRRFEGSDSAMRRKGR